MPPIHALNGHAGHAGHALTARREAGGVLPRGVPNPPSQPIPTDAFARIRPGYPHGPPEPNRRAAASHAAFNQISAPMPSWRLAWNHHSISMAISGAFAADSKNEAAPSGNEPFAETDASRPAGAIGEPGPGEGDAKDASRPRSRGGEPLDEADMAIIRELRQRDTAVRRHEQAHVSAGGNLVSGAARYQYKQGPDGKSYAVGGEVSIDISGANTPEATMAKMRRVRAAALAPADPSAQDRRVAASAAQREQQAMLEAAQIRQEEAAAKKPKNAEEPLKNQAKIRGGDHLAETEFPV